MKLAYVPIENFGDELNPWIWGQLIKEGLDVSSENCSPGQINSDINLLSIGSYLHSGFLKKFSPSKKAVVAGTGSGYGLMSTPFSWGVQFPYKSKLLFKLPVATPQDRYSDSRRFYWVRGPLTAHVMGLPKETAVADGAYLLRKVMPVNEIPRGDGVAFMPHMSSASLSIWPDICSQIGFTYIDPRETRVSVMQKISQASVLVTDALHGAIVSDALRTPWVPVRTSQCILEFKWRDHCSSIGLDYKPIDIPAFWDTASVMKSQRSLPKKALFAARTKIANQLISKEKVATELLYASKSQAYLSKDSVISAIDEKLELLVEKIKLDMREDPFFQVERNAELVQKL